MVLDISASYTRELRAVEGYSNDQGSKLIYINFYLFLFFCMYIIYIFKKTELMVSSQTEPEGHHTMKSVCLLAEIQTICWS